MKGYVYVMLMSNHQPLNLEVIQRHVDHLKQLDTQEKLVLCGPFLDYSGGMVVIHADSLEDAHLICQQDPFIQEGYKTYELRTLEVANQENGYGMD